MGKVVKVAAFAVGGVVGLLVIALGVLYGMGSARIGKTYDIPRVTVAVPTDPASIARGKHLAEAVVGCVGCHGENLAGGEALIDDPAVASVYAANITRGKGGVGSQLSDADFARAIRHGVRRDGTPMWIMPSEAYYHLSDKDLGDVIAYLKSVPPVDKEVPQTSAGPMGRILLAAGAFPPLAAEIIDHAGPRPDAPPAAASKEYGDYLVRVSGCWVCHGASLAGGQPPNPSSPPAPSLTRDGLAGWAEADFVRALRTGAARRGGQLSDFMPWKEYRRLSDDELKAIWLALQAAPSTATAGR